MEQIKPLREMEPKERIGYIWDYYRAPIIGAIAAIAIAIGIIHYYAAYRSPALELLMINVSSDDDILGDTFAGFLDDNGFDSAKDTVKINSTLSFDPESGSDYTSMATFQAWLMGESYTGIFSDEAVFTHYASSAYFRDLSELLTDDELLSLSDRLLYADLGDGSAPYPCAIALSADNCAWLLSYGYGDCYFGILFNVEDDALARALIRYIVGL